jgi:hypothetical protein
LPLCLELVKGDNLKKFILKCLAKEDTRPTATELLQDEFLD